MADLTVDLTPTPGFIHVVLAVWVPEQGWLTTAPEPTHMPDLPIDEKVAFKAKAGARAIMAAFQPKDHVQLPLPMVPTHSGNSCHDCGSMMIRTGSCETCTGCGTTGGCG